MVKRVIQFFDKLEDKIRGKLSRYPIVYALIGGVGIVLFWRGVWHTTDTLPFIKSGPVSLIVGSLILLLTGIFVSAFVGSRLILTGLKGEKKQEEKAEEILETEEMQIQDIQTTVRKLEHEMEDIQKEIERHHPEKK